LIQIGARPLDSLDYEKGFFAAAYSQCSPDGLFGFFPAVYVAESGSAGRQQGHIVGMMEAFRLL
jgi:hypothetical protein